MTLLSRVLGFARDVVVARAFGAGAGTDAFFVVFKIPNFLRRLFAEGAFAQAFVPMLSEYKTARSPEAVRELTDRVAGTLSGVLFLVTLAGVIAAPVLVMVFAPGFLADRGKYDLAAGMLRITFPYLLFISLTAFAGGILNSYNRFAVPAFTPVFLNLCLIGAAIWLAPHMEQPITALAWGVFLAGVVQLTFQLPFLRSLGLLPRPRWGWRYEGVQRILKLMLPTLLGSSVAQINLLVDTLLASFLVTGSVTWLYYSDRMVEFPLGMFGITLATVILPKLSREHTRASFEHFSDTLDWALRWALLIGTPTTLGLLLLAGPLLATLFQYGVFAAHDVYMAAQSLAAYALGLMGFILVKVLLPAFYARQDTRTPVRIAVGAILSNLVLSLALIFPLAHAGLALATSLAALINASLLYVTLCRRKYYRPLPGWVALLLRVSLANTVMAVVLWIGVEELDAWLRWNAFERAWHLSGWIAAGAGTYFLALLVVGIRPRHIQAAHPAREVAECGDNRAEYIG
jgi:integral membrane protein MviN